MYFHTLSEMENKKKKSSLYRFHKNAFCVYRRVHSSVSESAGYHEAEAPGEGAVHQHAGSGQGGDEGTMLLPFIACEV